MKTLQEHLQEIRERLSLIESRLDRRVLKHTHTVNEIVFLEEKKVTKKTSLGNITNGEQEIISKILNMTPKRSVKSIVKELNTIRKANGIVPDINYNQVYHVIKKMEKAL